MVYLGDVATALIHGLQEAATLTMTRPPKFDEQRWELEVKTGDMTVRIHSRPYWGFGLLTKGYLNVLNSVDRRRFVTVPSSIWRRLGAGAVGFFLGRQQRTESFAVSIWTAPATPRRGRAPSSVDATDFVTTFGPWRSAEKRWRKGFMRGWTMWTTSQQPRFANTA
ncbi:MAG: hypothetical protein CM15mP128_5080 [Methanobacteriota archaeon]|nr:MAG: hypothetical protein CM15mP128_5080 [Euryarchaeota archaeon]